MVRWGFTPGGLLQGTRFTSWLSVALASGTAARDRSVCRVGNEREDRPLTHGLTAITTSISPAALAAAEDVVVSETLGFYFSLPQVTTSCHLPWAPSPSHCPAFASWTSQLKPGANPPTDQALREVLIDHDLPVLPDLQFFYLCCTRLVIASRVTSCSNVAYADSAIFEYV